MSEIALAEGQLIPFSETILTRNLLRCLDALVLAGSDARIVNRQTTTIDFAPRTASIIVT